MRTRSGCWFHLELKLHPRAGEDGMKKNGIGNDRSHHDPSDVILKYAAMLSNVRK